MKKINIAIDGPSGAGKSTISDLLASQLNYIHLDTGAMYRSVAFVCQSKGISFEDEETVSKEAESLEFRQTLDGKIYANGEDVTDAIRQNEISMGASAVSRYDRVRKALVAMQQKISEQKGYIVDGRDIGTVVLTGAEVKIYLVATAEERAKRRVAQNLEKGIEADYETILRDIEQRDYQDMNRENSPLKKADDAIEVDSSFMSIEEVVEAIMSVIKEAL